MTREWVERAWKMNPCAKLSNGDVRTGPVRLSFPHLFKAGKPVEADQEGKFGAVLLFPLGADISVIKAEASRVAKDKWPTIGTPQAPKLKNPVQLQDENTGRYAGYVEGAYFIRTISNQKITPVDRNMAPVIDESAAYPGVWAVVTMRALTYDKKLSKGVTFGLQNVMLIADDTNIGGTAAANPRDAFAGVTVEAGDIDADKAFGEGAKASAPEVDIFS